MSPLSSFILIAGLALQAGAVTIPVSVGKVGLVFEPSTIRAAQGDIIEFRFWARNHSVVSGNWNQACTPATSGGFYSGFNFPTEAGAANTNVFRVTINDTNPIVFYCSQNTGSHCKNGMVGVINPSGGNTLESYVNAAKSASTAVSPLAGIFGGVIAQGATSTMGGSSTGTGTATGTATPTGTGSGAGALAVPLAGLGAAGFVALFLM